MGDVVPIRKSKEHFIQKAFRVAKVYLNSVYDHYFFTESDLEALRFTSGSDWRALFQTSSDIPLTFVEVTYSSQARKCKVTLYTPTSETIISDHPSEQTH